MKTDPRTLVHEVDKTTAPDLWPEIQGRRPGPPLPSPPNKSRLAAGALAFVVAAGALTFGYQALRLADETDRRHQATPVPKPSINPSSPESWHAPDGSWLMGEDLAAVLGVEASRKPDSCGAFVRQARTASKAIASTAFTWTSRTSISQADSC